MKDKLHLRKIKSAILKLLLIFSSFFIAFPFIWMVSNSIKTKEEIWALPPKLLPKFPQWVNYLNVLKDSNFFHYIWNSTSIAVICTAITLINSAMFAYALVFIRFKGHHLVHLLIMATYIVPAAVTYIPSYILLSRLNLIDSQTGYVISSAANIFNIFYYRTTFLQINHSIIEAADIDGAGHWYKFFKIVLPLSTPTTVTLGILSFIANYNNYLWPSLILKSKDKYFVSMGLRAFFSGQGAYGMKWGEIMAACCIVIMPLVIIFLLGQKHIMKGITNDIGEK